jgi:Leucine-rich repeat (LRR) protein
MNRTPKSISEEYRNKVVDKNSAIKELIVILENSDRVTERLKCINMILSIGNDFENLGLSKDELFSIFESLLISDINEKIRSEAATIIFQKFNDRALPPLSWALHHDVSPYSLTKILNSLIMLVISFQKSEDSLTKSILLSEIKQIEEVEFKICLELKQEDLININQLGEILINYYIIVYLKKLYWRLKYTIEKCKITQLNFIFKGLTSLPESLKYLKSLKLLTLRYNQILNIPSWISSLRSLEILNLNVNNLDELPKEIGDLGNLKELLLWKNNLRALPNTIGSLKSLEKLNLRLNQIERVPNSVSKLSKLKELDLHDNKLTQLPINLSSLESLESLNLSWNSLKTLPKTIGNLCNLKILNLEKNEIEQIPQTITNLSSLEILNLCENKIRYLPEDIGMMNNLKILKVTRNQIETLPESIRDISSLQELHLWENKIERLPQFLTDLEYKGLKIYY